MQQRGHIRDHRPQLLDHRQRLIERLLEVHSLDLVVTGQLEVVVIEHRLEFVGETVGVEDIAQPEPAPGDLVLVGRPDAPTGGADLVLAPGDLAGLVEGNVIGQDQRAGGTDAQPLPHRHSLVLQLGDLRQQRVGGEHHAVADQAGDVLAQYARGDEVQDRFLAVYDQRVTGIVPTLESYDRVDLVGEQVHDLALAFVTPLGAQHHHVLVHTRSSTFHTPSCSTSCLSHRGST